MAYRKMSFGEHAARTWERFKAQPKSNLIFAALIIAAIIYVVVPDKRGKEFHRQVEEEIQLARVICEESLGWVLENRKRLKMGQSDLKNFKLNGYSFDLEYVDYPEVLFFDTGFRSATVDSSKVPQQDFFCVFSDPRSSSADFYYDYSKRRWVDKIRFRR